jgi:Zn-finger nucleic acid-binding protein
MRTYERSGVTVDQCTECRGIFLDRGELEKLFEAEANWNQQPGTPPRQQPGYPAPGHAPPPPPPVSQGYPPPPPPPVSHGYPPAPAYGGQQQHHGYHGHYQRKRKKSFLNELFD